MASSHGPERPSSITPDSSSPSPEQAAAEPRGWLIRNGLYLLLPVAAVWFLSYRYDLDLGFWAKIGIAALGLGLVIFIHELGHFLVAKWCDVHVETFSIGFGPPLPGCCFKRGETTYMIALFPLGGYVKMVGEGAENDESDTDPRSFKNKSVWQRMAIISAGVTMNVLLAFLCFVFVFRTHGDEQTPGVINLIDAGSRAWEKGVKTGDIIWWIGDEGPRPSFNDQLRPEVMNSREGEVLRFVFGPPGVPEAQATHTKIVPRYEKGDPHPTIGINPPMQLKLLAGEERKAQQKPVWLNSAAAAAEPPLEFDDEIIATTDPDNPGEVAPLPPDPRNPEHLDYFEFKRRMRRLASREVTLQVRRASGEVVTVRVPPAFHHTFGMRLRMGPIAAVRDGSPAQRAGVQAGDIIDRVEVRDSDGKLVVFGGTAKPKDAVVKALDPERLPFELSRWAERGNGPKEVMITVLRKNLPTDHQERQPVRLTLEWDDRWRDNDEIPINQRSPLSVPGLGLAYQIEAIVVDVAPGSSAEKAGLQKDDIIKAVRFYQRGKTPADEPEPGKWNDLKPDQWAAVFYTFQTFSEFNKLDVKVERDKAELRLVAEEDREWPMDSRGFRFIEDKQLYRAESLGEAVAMGVRKTKNFIMQIYGNLRGFITRRISTDLLGGPIMIGTVAFHFASDIYRFIVFIGIISVNLAVVNFLPVPVLDGGHMVFLIYEKLRGKPAPEPVRVAATMAGLALLLLLMGFVIYLDVSRLIS